MAAAVAGQLDEKRLAELVAEAAHAQLVNTYRGELRTRSERLFVNAFHAALVKDGAADQLLDSLRDRFQEVAEAITEARTLIPTNQPAEAFLRTAETDAVTFWPQLDGHIATLDAIGRIPAQFGCRTGNFPQFEAFALGDGFRLEGRAIFCANGPNEQADSAAFRGTGTHRASPWFRMPLRLNTVAQAVECYRVWAEASWDASHPNRVVQHQTPDGKVGEFTLQNH